MLKIENLTKSYGNTVALESCNLHLRPYGIYGVLGKNGCGKSTLFKSIMGLLDPDSGSILYKGQPIIFENRKKIGYMPEQRSMLLDLTVKEQLMFLGELKSIPDSVLQSRIEELCASFELDQLLERRVGSLSKGQQQKVQLVSALLHDPELLILDEPLNGLDYFSVLLFMRRLRQFAAKGNAILLSSHQMDFMDELCTDVLVLDRGKSLKQGRLEVLQEDYGVCISVNGNGRWQGLEPEAQTILDKGSRVELHYSELKDAKKALARLSKEPSVTHLNLHYASIGSMLEENL